MRDPSVAERIVVEAFGRVRQESAAIELGRVPPRLRLLAIVHGSAVTAGRAGQASLRADGRDPLELAYFAGCTRAQIAERLGITVAEATGRLAAALRELAARSAAG